MAKKQKIKCDVESCKHQNTEDEVCELNEIKVSCNCNNDECESNDETVCESFESVEDDIDDDDIGIEVETNEEEEEEEEYSEENPETE